MEAVREAVKVIEEELILNFHEDASNPVSSAFSGLLTQTGKNEMLPFTIPPILLCTCTT